MSLTKRLLRTPDAMISREAYEQAQLIRDARIEAALYRGGCSSKILQVNPLYA